MAYFKPSIDAEGLKIPTYQDVLDELIDRYKNIFGQDVYLEPDSPDYQLLSVFAKMTSDNYSLVTDVYNSRNPNYASGNSLDVIVALNGIRRESAEAAKVILTLTGTAGTEIEKGKRAIDIYGYVWETMSTVTLDSEGTATVEAQCTTRGAILVEPGEVNSIYTPFLGWSGVTNEARSYGGQDVESDAELRARRKQSIVMKNNGSIDSLMKALIDIDGVTSVRVYENSTGTTDLKGVPGHSFLTVIEGGTDADIAEAIYKAKTIGVGTYGGITVNYVDSYGQTNAIKFSRPSPVSVSVKVTIRALSGYDASRVDGIIKSAIAADIESLGIGDSWTVSLGYRDVYNAFAGTDIPFALETIEAKRSSDWVTNTIECDFDEVLACSTSNVTIELDQE